MPNPARIGTVTTLTGEAWAETGGRSRLLKTGEAVFEGEVIKTGSGSNLEIKFLDGTLLGQGQDAEVALDDYVFSDDDNALAFNMVKGVMRVVSGNIAKVNPDAFNLKSPAATIGIRGTSIVLKIDANGEIVGVTEMDPSHRVVVNVDGNEAVITVAGTFSGVSATGGLLPVQTMPQTFIDTVRQAVPLTGLGEPPRAPGASQDVDSSGLDTTGSDAGGDNGGSDGADAGTPVAGGDDSVAVTVDPATGDATVSGDTVTPETVTSLTIVVTGVLSPTTTTTLIVSTTTIALDGTSSTDDVAASLESGATQETVTEPITVVASEDDGTVTTTTTGTIVITVTTTTTTTTTSTDDTGDDDDTTTVTVTGIPEQPAFDNAGDSMSWSGITWVDSTGNDASMQGSASADYFKGLDGNDSLYGGDGNDSMVGGEGEDYLQGDSGNDTLSGGSGRDTLVGGAGADVLFGGEGNDTYKFLAPTDGGDTIYGFGTNNDKFVFVKAAFGIASVNRNDFVIVDSSTYDNSTNPYGSKTGAGFVYASESGSDEGRLYYEPDPTNAGDEVLLAHIYENPGSGDIGVGDFNLA